MGTLYLPTSDPETPEMLEPKIKTKGNPLSPVALVPALVGHVVRLPDFLAALGMACDSKALELYEL